MMKQASIMAMALLLIACGGSSGGGSSAVVSSPPPPPTPPPPPPPPPSSMSLRFSNVAVSRGLQFSTEYSVAYDEMPRHFAGGVAAGDIDNDGDIDLFVTRGDTQANLLLINQGGSFSDNASAAGVAIPTGTGNFKLSGPTFADMDGDGDLDLFIGGLQNDPSLLYLNNGDGTFSDVTIGSGIDMMDSKNTISAAFGDYDNDGDLDLAMAHWGTPRDRLNPGETETLWRNDSDNSVLKFTAVSQASGIADELALDLSASALGVDHDYTFAPNFADINNDGYADLLSVSDFRGSRVFVNNQDGTFSNTTDETQINDSNGMGAAAADYDNDGDIDWFVSSIDGNRLYKNYDGTLINESDAAGIGPGSWGWGSCFADFDLDGHVDIYQTNGWVSDSGSNPNAPYTTDKSRLWISDGNGTFEDKASDANMVDEEQGRAIVCADFDNDRDIDVLLISSNTQQAAILWENQISNQNAIKINLEGPAPNSQGIGTRISVRTGSTTQTREMTIGSNFASHNPAEEIFGLGAQTTIDEIIITWSDGTETRETNVQANQDLLFTHLP